MAMNNLNLTHPMEVARSVLVRAGGGGGGGGGFPDGQPLGTIAGCSSRTAVPRVRRIGPTERMSTNAILHASRLARFETVTMK